MNTIKIFICFLAFSVSIQAQSYEDVLRYSQPQYNGTARSVSMGGAFGSLGGDFSALGINPAGIATYRSSEFTLTPSVIINSTETNFAYDKLSDNKLSDNKTTFAINQIGYVGTYRPMREVKKGLVSSHFAIGYNRNNNFNYKSMASARNIGNSMTDMFNINAYGLNPNSYDKDNPQEWDPYSYKTGLAYKAFLISDDGKDDNDNYYYTSYLHSEDNVDQTKFLEKDGYSGEINLTAGANISNILMIGASINFTTLRYKERSNYYEQYSKDNLAPADKVFEQYTVNDYLNASGTGVNLKLGFILKPIGNLRIGAAYHSPTWYKMEEDYGTTINASYFNYESESANYDGRYDYKLNTPEKVIASASYVFGKIAIVSFDYEYMNYASAKFKTTTNNYNDFNFINDQNKIIKETFTSTNNYRLGAEVRVNKQISLRGGYSFQATPYKTNTDDYQITSITGGLGYHNSNYFIDIAYKHSSYETNYLNYDWHPDNDDNYGVPPFTKAKTFDHYAVLTVGWKF